MRWEMDMIGRPGVCGEVGIGRDYVGQIDPQ